MLQEPNSDFAFDNLTLGAPNGLQGGSYFTKLLLDDNNIYLQIPKCQTKQGIVVTEKKKYCDLMFSRDSNDVIAWFENIERRVQQLLFEKKNIWFHDDLEMSDIENAFTSPIRSYKSGNFYLVRCSVPKVISPETISCYNENEEPVNLEEINEKDTQIIPIIEVQGVRFSSKNFQIELGIRQVMVIKKKELFKKCMIRLEKPDNEIATPVISQDNEEVDTEINDNRIEQVEEVISTEPEPSVENQLVEDIVEEKQMDEEPEINTEQEKEIISDPVEEEIQTDIEVANKKPAEVELCLAENNEEESKTIDSISEIDISTISSNSEESLKLKDPSEVYYEIYKKARERAKNAKREALAAYLEAKQIKEHYMLNVLESDSESEIESVEDLEENECTVLA